MNEAGSSIMKQVFLLTFIFLLKMNLLAVNDSSDIAEDTIIFKQIYQNHHTVDAKIDTVLDRFSFFNPVHEDQQMLYLGNLGGAHYYLNNFDNLFDRKPFILNNVAYLFSLDPIPLYNTKRPFTKIDYFNLLGSKSEAEQYLKVLHTQNVNRRLNFGFAWDYLDSEGEFSNQKHTYGLLNFFTNYEGEKYRLRLNALYNSFQMDNFGGVDSANYYGSVQSTKNYLTNLTESNSRFRNKGILIDQQFHVLRDSSYKSSLGYEFRYEDYRMEYSDRDPLNNFYHFTIDSSGTFDSLSSRNINNKIYFHFTSDKAFIPDFVVSYGLDFYTRGNLQHSFDSLEHGKFSNRSFYTQKTSVHFLYDHLKKWFFQGQYHYYFDGYDKGATVYNFAMQRFFGEREYLFFNLDISYKNKAVDPYLHNYSSNHVQWNDPLLNPGVHSYNISFGTTDNKIDVGLDYYMIRNFFYFDNDFKPVQYNGNMYVSSLYCKFRVDLYKFSSAGKVASQSANRDFYPVPELMIFNSTWFSHSLHFKKTGGLLHMQLGVNTRYLASFQSYRYIPVINQFIYDESLDFKTGGFPVFDAFLALKIKTVCLLFKYENMNVGAEEKNYYYIYPYPASQSRFIFGLSWNFYN